MEKEIEKLIRRTHAAISTGDALNITRATQMIMKLIKEERENGETESVPPRSIPFQICPKCDGQGSVSKPPHIPGDVQEWCSSSISHVCDVCEGSKIILESPR